MNAAVVLLWLAVRGLGVAAVALGLRLVWIGIERLAEFVRHELDMQPKNMYFRM